MGSEHYCLRWNNHQNNLLGVFSQLLQEESLVDVTLACSEEGRLIRAHKVVLSACSAYFKALFLDHPTRHPIVVLKDVQFSELRDLVEFMYRGEVNVDHRQLTTLLKTAESLKVKGLADMARPSDGDDDTVGDRVELVPADRDDEPMEPEDLRPLSRCRTPVPTDSRTPSPAPTESDNLSMQSEPSDMTTVCRRDQPSPSGSGLPPVQQVPLVSTAVWNSHHSFVILNLMVKQDMPLNAIQGTKMSLVSNKLDTRLSRCHHSNIIIIIIITLLLNYST